MLLPPDVSTELTAYEQYEEKRLAELAGVQAVSAMGRIRRYVRSLTLMAEGEIEDPAYQRQAVQMVEEVDQDAHAIAGLLHELVARYVALLAMFQKAVRQRDEALYGQQAWLDDLADRVAEHQACTRDQAYKLLTVLLHSDEELLECDVVLGLDRLIVFRDELQPLIEHLEAELDLPEEA